MAIQRKKRIITREDLRPSLVTEMQEKETTGTLNAETDIVPYFFYLATRNKPLNLYAAGMQSSAMVFESAFRSRADDSQIRLAEETRNLAYAHKCAYQLIDQGFIPYGSHIKYIGPLNDADSHHRCVGITMGKLEEVNVPNVTIFPECGVSLGIIYGSHLHVYLNKTISINSLAEGYKQSIGLHKSIPLSYQEGVNIVNCEILAKQEEIIQAIDEKIGVKTI